MLSSADAGSSEHDDHEQEDDAETAMVLLGSLVKTLNTVHRGMAFNRPVRPYTHISYAALTDALAANPLLRGSSAIRGTKWTGAAAVGGDGERPLTPESSPGGDGGDGYFDGIGDSNGVWPRGRGGVRGYVSGQLERLYNLEHEVQGLKLRSELGYRNYA